MWSVGGGGGRSTLFGFVVLGAFRGWHFRPKIDLVCRRWHLETNLPRPTCDTVATAYLGQGYKHIIRWFNFWLVSHRLYHLKRALTVTVTRFLVQTVQTCSFYLPWFIPILKIAHFHWAKPGKKKADFHRIHVLVLTPGNQHPNNGTRAVSSFLEALSPSLSSPPLKKVQITVRDL